MLWGQMLWVLLLCFGGAGGSAPGETCLEDEAREGRPINTHDIEAVQAWLNEHPSSSVRVISSALGLPVSSVYAILTDSLGLRKFKSKWIPHELTEAQKLKRVQLSRDLLGKLATMKENELCSVVIADESWFYLTTKRDGMWEESPKDVPPHVKATVGSPK